MSVNKIIIITIIVAICLWSSIWTFNHVQPYLGILLFLLTGISLFNYLKSKKQENEKKF